MALNPFDDAVDELPAPQAAAAVNPYDEIVSDHRTEQAATLRTSVMQGATQTPERASQVRTYADRFGLPPSVVEHNFDTYQHKARIEDAAQIAEHAPALGSWLAKDPANAAVAQDDLGPLSALSRALTIGRNIAGAAGAGVMGFSQGIWGAIEAAAELPSAPGGMNRLVGQVPAPAPTIAADDPRLATFAHGAALVAQHLAERVRGPQTGAGFAERAAYSGIESIGQMAPGLVAAAATGGSGLLLSLAGLTTGGQSYTQAREQGVTPSKALAFGTIQGAIEVGTEFLPAHLLLRDLKASAPLVTVLAHQIASELPGEEVATALQDLNEWAFLPANKDRTFTDYLHERPSAAAATAISVLVSVGATAVVTHGTVRMVEQLGKAAETSKTVGRDPGAVQAAMEHVDAHGGDTPTQFYAKIDPFTAYWQEQGIDPAVMAQTLTGSPTAYAEAVASGTPLAISPARYAATLAATPHNEFFTNELTLDPTAMNGREYAALLAEPPAPAPTAEPSPVRTAVLQQLVQAGMTAETAAPNADLFASATGAGVFGEGLATRAGDVGRGGVDLPAFYAKYGLTVGRPDVGATITPQPTQAASAASLGTEAAPASETLAGAPVAAPVASTAYSDYVAQFDKEMATVSPVETLEAKIARLEGDLRSATRAAETDALTGVANRAALDKALPTAEADPHTSVVVFDANNFGQVNKLAGQEAGDAMIQQVAGAIQQAAAEFGVGERVFRRGGDEFVVLAPAAVADQVRARAETLFGQQPIVSDAWFVSDTKPVIVSLSGTTAGSFREADATLQAAKQAAKAQQLIVDRTLDVTDNSLDYLNAETRDAATAQEGTRPADTAGQQPRVDVHGDVQGRGDGPVVESGGPAPRGLPGADEIFVREAQSVTESRLTPEVERNLRWILEEFENFPYTKASWHWLGDEDASRGKSGNAGGGDYAMRPAVGGAPVYADVIGYSPVNLTTGGKRKGQPAREAGGSRAKVEAAIRTLLETRHVTTNLMEGALRVAENRNAGNWKDLERPLIPPPWGTPVSREFTDALSDAIDQPGDAVDTGGDASFDITEFDQGLFDQLPPTSAPADTLTTGEVQPRLPGDTGAVREQNVATPAFDAPFALTSETAQTKTKQSTLFQGPTPPRRGAIRFGPDRQFNITLLERADLSTFLHETGHFFLEVFGDVVDTLQTVDAGSRTPEQSQILADYTATLQALGVDTRAAITTPQHEQFARLFEAYLMEGQAPSVELRSAFGRFRAWLLGIYQSLTKLNVRLTPEVRGVFDRLLASDQAIADAQAAQGVPLFTTAESAGMTPEQFALYRQTVTEAATSARERLDRTLMAEVQREQTAVWKAQRAEIQATVEAETDAQPVYRALAAILKGEQPNGEPLVEALTTPPLSLSRTVVRDAFGGAARVASLPANVTVAEGGLHPDTVAELFGFSSGDELLTALSQAPPRRQVIDSETSRRMLAEHGSLLLDGTLHAAAEAAVAGDSQERVIRAELAALHTLQRTVRPFERQARSEATAAAGEKVTALTGELSRLKRNTRSGAATIRAGIPTADMVRAAATARIAATPVRRLQPYTFWVAGRQASRAAVEHAARQDFTAAIGAKTDELLNLAYYREATRAKEDATARAAYARSLATPGMRKSIGLASPAYLDQVDGILDRFEFAKVSGTTLDRRAALLKFATALEADGLPAEFPAILLDEARRLNYQDLTVEELVGVTDGLKQIVHLAQLKNRLLKSADARAFAEVRDSLADSIREKNAVKKLPLEFRPSDEKYRKVKAWFASHAKIAILARGLDGHQDGGPMWEAIIRPVNAAADAETVRTREAGATYAAILQAHYPGRELAALQSSVFIPAINASLSKEARLAVLLNWGNQTSRDRLLNDPTRQWNEGQIRAIIDTLDARDGRFVQATWDYVNSFWGEIAAKQQRVTGVAPEKVEALPVATPFGSLTGGYYPLAYDGRLAPRADQLAAVSDAKLAVSAAYVSATTRRGHTQARVEGVRLPVKLELGVLFRHLTAVIHDLTHHEMLIDTTRLLRDAAVQAALIETQGDLVYQQFTSALQDIALGSSSGRGQPTALDSAASFMKTGTQIAGLGWNLWTALQQPLGIFNGMSRVGPVWVARGMKRWLRDAASMENTHAWIQDVSPMMRERAGTLSQDLHDLRGALREPGGWFDRLVRTVSADHLTQQTITDGFLWHIGLAQRVADVPTWLGGYEKAMADPVEGRTLAAHEARAIALADQGVLDAQGGGQIKDLAQVQRGSPVAKLFMTFYSYGNMLGNATAERYQATNLKSPASVATFLGHLSLLYVLPALGTVALARAFGKGGGGGDDTPEKFLGDVGQEMLGTALNTLVFVRELGGLVRGGARGYEGPAGTRLIQLVTALGQQVQQGTLDAGLEKAALAVSGVLFRYPSAQVQRTIDGWVALHEGRTHNPGVLLVGPPPKKAAR